MIMKTNLRKMILWTIALLAISIMTTSSVNPGYNEFGNDLMNVWKILVQKAIHV